MASIAQVTELDNDSEDSNDYLGWDGTVDFELTVKHKAGHGISWWTANSKRMMLTSDGAFWIDGTIGETPASGAGTRLMWIPKKQAFRAGIVQSTQWNDASIGDYSAAFGKNNESTGSGSFSTGESNEASGTNSVTLGLENEASDDYGFAAGRGNDSQAFGSITMGKDNTSIDNYCVAMGLACTAGGAYGLQDSEACFALGDGCLAVGHDSFALGEWVESEGLVTFAIGQGESVLLPLVNDVDQSLGIGFGVQDPTFFVGSGDNTPDDCGDVGIGLGGATPGARFDVNHDVSDESTSYTSVIVDMEGAKGLSSINTGVKIELYKDPATTITGHNYGLHSEVEAGRNNRAVFADAKCTSQTSAAYGVHASGGGTGSSTSNNTGVYGYGHHGSNCKGVHGNAYNGSLTNYGVYGQASGTQAYAGYFLGNVHRTGTDNFTSDQNLKKDISDIENGLDIILSLSPKTYEFRCDEYPDLGLDSGAHCGLLAQEVEEVLPDLVNTVLHYDFGEDGEVVGEPLEIRSIAYIELIPLLIQAVKEEHAYSEGLQAQLDSLEEVCSEIDDLSARLDDVNQLIESCCYTSGGGGGAFNGSLSDDFQSTNYPLVRNDDLFLAPNPFTNSSTVNYTLSCECHARIMVFNSMGQIIQTLVDEVRHAGSHQLELNAQNLPAGIFYIALEVNGTELVRRAIKIN